MNEGPFRPAQPADRRVIGRAEPATSRQLPEQPAQTAKVDPAPTAHRAAASHGGRHEPTPPKKSFKIPVIIGLILVLAAAAWFGISSLQQGATAIDNSKYQAVFFTNGQVYFGKLNAFNGEFMQLNEVYYLQTQSEAGDDVDALQNTSNDQSNVQLIKLGDEIHGPEDQMMISKDQILFYENLKPDGRVSESIEQYKSSNN